jgi:hypothetical protein
MVSIRDTQTQNVCTKSVPVFHLPVIHTVLLSEKYLSWFNFAA